MKLIHLLTKLITISLLSLIFSASLSSAQENTEKKPLKAQEIPFIPGRMAKNLDDNNEKQTEINQDLKRVLDETSESNATAPQNENETIKTIKDLAKTVDLVKSIALNQGDISSILLGDKTNSIMFDKKETENINRAITAFENKESLEVDDKSAAEGEVKEKVLPEQSYVYLASILYFSPTKWVVWIQNNKISSDSNSKDNEFYLKEVTSRKVKILWKLGITKWEILSGTTSEIKPQTNENNEVEMEFELQPNQTYALKTGDIFEGTFKNFIAKQNRVAVPEVKNKSKSDN